VLESPLCVSTPLEEIMIGEYVCIGCEIEIHSRILLVDFVILDMVGHDVIIGMD